MRYVAVIPVKAKSDRVPGKNFRDFSDGKSLLDLLISKLSNCESISKIYISSNEFSIRECVESRGCVFVERDDEYCNNDVPWSNVIESVVSALPEDDSTFVLWCHTTSPLFERYEEAIATFEEVNRDGSCDGLVTVKRLSEFIVSERGIPVNYAWGVWHPYSQDLDKLYAVSGALFIAAKKHILENKYVISRKPYWFETSDYEALDVDTPFDFELAKLMYQNRRNLKNL